MKVNSKYLNSLLFDLFEILQAVAKEFRLISNFVAVVTKTRIISLCLKQKSIVFHNKKCVSSIFLYKMILTVVIIKLYCFKLFFQKCFCLNNKLSVFQ